MPVRDTGSSLLCSPLCRYLISDPLHFYNLVPDEAHGGGLVLLQTRVGNLNVSLIYRVVVTLRLIKHDTMNPVAQTLKLSYARGTNKDTLFIRDPNQENIQLSRKVFISLGEKPGVCTEYQFPSDKFKTSMLNR